MNTVKILIEGYAKKIPKGWLASSTTTLIISDGIKIIVDPGTNRSKLVSELRKIKLRTSDIDYIFMTHYHPDHNLLAGIFEKAKILDDELVYEKDSQIEHNKKIPGTDIYIISTPGHDQFHGSLVVPTEKGNIVVAGDVFWWSNEENQYTDKVSLIAHKDPFLKDIKVLIQSRKKILEIADWIIPGHGKMFKNPLR